MRKRQRGSEDGDKVKRIRKLYPVEVGGSRWGEFMCGVHAMPIVERYDVGKLSKGDESEVIAELQRMQRTTMYIHDDEVSILFDVLWRIACGHVLDTTRCDALWCIAKLLTEGSVPEPTVRASGLIVKTIQLLSSSKHDSYMVPILMMWGNLAGDCFELADLLMRSGVLRVLVSRCRFRYSALCAWIMCNFAHWAPHLSSNVNAGLVAAVYPLIHVECAAMNALEALNLLCADVSVGVFEEMAAGVFSLIRLMNGTHDVRVRYACGTIIRWLMEYGSGVTSWTTGLKDAVIRLSSDRDNIPAMGCVCDIIYAEPELLSHYDVCQMFLGLMSHASKIVVIWALTTARHVFQCAASYPCEMLYRYYIAEIALEIARLHADDVEVQREITSLYSDMVRWAGSVSPQALSDIADTFEETGVNEYLADMQRQHTDG